MGAMIFEYKSTCLDYNQLYPVSKRVRTLFVDQTGCEALEI